MIEFYTLKTLKRGIELITGYSFSTITLKSYIRKGFIKPSIKLPYGNKTIRAYSETDIEAFGSRIDDLRKVGKIKLHKHNVK